MQSFVRPRCRKPGLGLLIYAHLRMLVILRIYLTSYTKKGLIVSKI